MKAGESPAGWVERNRRALTGGGRSLDGGEPGRMAPELFETASTRILLCRLSPYDDVRRSMTHRLLYWACRQRRGVYVDLAWLPPRADLAVLARHGVPWWLASGARRPPHAFDVVAVSISTQQEALNLPAALQASGLGLAFAERMRDAAHPLVVLGGHAAGAVPFLHGDAGPEAGSGGLVDVVCWGDGVGWLQEFLAAWEGARAAGTAKQEFLAGLAGKVAGTYVPAFYRHAPDGGRLREIAPVRPGIPPRIAYRRESAAEWLGGYDGGFIPFADEDEEEPLPLSAGCAYRCRYCSLGWMRGALECSDAAEFARAAGRIKAARAVSDLNLQAPDVCSTPRLVELVTTLQPLFRHVSVKSFTVDGWLRQPEAGALWPALEKHEFSLGVEGISPRLRAFLGKPATEAGLAAVIRRLNEGGLRQVKLFFIATGREEAGDLEAFDALLRQLARWAPACRFIVSFTPLFYAPFTPLQYAAMPPVTAALRRALEHSVTRAGHALRWSAAPAEIRLMNLLCRAGRRATPLLARLGLEHRALYYGGLSETAAAEALARLEAEGLAPAELERPLGADEKLPWDELQGGASDDALRRSGEAAQEQLEVTAPAVGPSPVLPPARPVRAGAALSGPVEPVRVYACWAQLGPADAWRPGVTLARGLWSRVLAAWPPAARAYRGAPGLVRPLPTAGLALLQGAFCGTPWEGWTLPAGGLAEDGRSLLSGPGEPPAVPPDDWLSEVWTTGADGFPMLGKLEAALRARRVSYRTVRRGDRLYFVLGRSFRRRTGLVAFARCADGAAVLYGTARLRELADGLWPVGVAAPVVAAIYGPAEQPCAVCGGEPWAPLRARPGASPAFCPDCLLRSPGGRRVSAPPASAG